MLSRIGQHRWSDALQSGTNISKSVGLGTVTYIDSRGSSGMLRELAAKRGLIC